MPRRLAFALVLALLALFAGYAGLWYWAAGRLEAQLAAVVAAQAAEGREVGYARAAVRGFPFALRLVIEAPRVSDPAGWRWRGPDIDGEAVAWAPERLRLRLPGIHEIAWGIGAAAQSAEISAEAATADLRLPGGLLRPRAGLGFRIEARGLRLPPAAGAPLPGPIDSLLLAGRMTGELPRAASRPALAAWRDSGGVLELERADLDWGALRLRADATLALDGALRPLAAGTARIGGLPELIDGLRAEGAISRELALALRFGALAAARPDPQTGVPTVVLPVSAQDGKLRLGAFEIAEVGPLF